MLLAVGSAMVGNSELDPSVLVDGPLAIGASLLLGTTLDGVEELAPDAPTVDVLSLTPPVEAAVDSLESPVDVSSVMPASATTHVALSWQS